MFTEIITPMHNPVLLELPEELLGHRVRLTAVQEETRADQEFKNLWSEALSFWQSQRVDMSNFTFDRDAANQR
jgi:hypothetical protein